MISSPAFSEIHFIIPPESKPTKYYFRVRYLIPGKREVIWETTFKVVHFTEILFYVFFSLAFDILNLTFDFGKWIVIFLNILFQWKLNESKYLINQYRNIKLISVVC